MSGLFVAVCLLFLRRCVPRIWTVAASLFLVEAAATEAGENYTRGSAQHSSIVPLDAYHPVFQQRAAQENKATDASPASREADPASAEDGELLRHPEYEAVSQDDTPEVAKRAHEDLQKETHRHLGRRRGGSKAALLVPIYSTLWKGKFIAPNKPPIPVKLPFPKAVPDISKFIPKGATPKAPLKMLPSFHPHRHLETHTGSYQQGSRVGVSEPPESQNISGTPKLVGGVSALGRPEEGRRVESKSARLRGSPDVVKLPPSPRVPVASVHELLRRAENLLSVETSVNHGGSTAADFADQQASQATLPPTVDLTPLFQGKHGDTSSESDSDVADFAPDVVGEGEVGAASDTGLHTFGELPAETPDIAQNGVKKEELGAEYVEELHTVPEEPAPGDALPGSVGDECGAAAEIISPSSNSATSTRSEETVSRQGEMKDTATSGNAAQVAGDIHTDPVVGEYRTMKDRSVQTLLEAAESGAQEAALLTTGATPKASDEEEQGDISSGSDSDMPDFAHNGVGKEEVGAVSDEGLQTFSEAPAQSEELPGCVRDGCGAAGEIIPESPNSAELASRVCREERDSRQDEMRDTATLGSAAHVAGKVGNEPAIGESERVRDSSVQNLRAAAESSAEDPARPTADAASKRSDGEEPRLEQEQQVPLPSFAEQPSEGRAGHAQSEDGQEGRSDFIPSSHGALVRAKNSETEKRGSANAGGGLEVRPAEASDDVDGSEVELWHNGGSSPITKGHTDALLENNTFSASMLDNAGGAARFENVSGFEGSRAGAQPDNARRPGVESESGSAHFLKIGNESEVDDPFEIALRNGSSQANGPVGNSHVSEIGVESEKGDSVGDSTRLETLQADAYVRDARDRGIESNIEAAEPLLQSRRPLVDRGDGATALRVGAAASPAASSRAGSRRPSFTPNGQEAEVRKEKASIQKDEGMRCLVAKKRYTASKNPWSVRARAQPPMVFFYPPPKQYDEREPVHKFLPGNLPSLGPPPPCYGAGCYRRLAEHLHHFTTVPVGAVQPSQPMSKAPVQHVSAVVVEEPQKRKRAKPPWSPKLRRVKEPPTIRYIPISKEYIPLLGWPAGYDHAAPQPHAPAPVLPGHGSGQDLFAILDAFFDNGPDFLLSNMYPDSAGGGLMTSYTASPSSGFERPTSAPPAPTGDPAVATRTRRSGTRSPTRQSTRAANGSARAPRSPSSPSPGSSAASAGSSTPAATSETSSFPSVPQEIL